MECAQSDDVLRFLDYESYFALTKTPIPVHTLELLHILEHEKFIRSRDDGNWDILNLGCLAFARDLGDSDTLGRKSLRVVRYSGSAKYVKSQQSEFSMGYAAGFARIIDHVNSISPIDEIFIGGIRKQEAHIPVASVREVIANALIHQDFVVRGIEPLIEIFDNRIEVVNPGVPLLDKRLFVNAPPESRNEALAKLFRRLGICEQLGIGWDKIVYESELLQLPAPQIEVFSNSTRVTLYGATPLSEMNPADRVRAIYLHACLRYADQRSAITNATVRKRFGIVPQNSAMASRFLRDALATGDIVPLDSRLSKKFMQYMPYWARPSVGQ